MPGKHKPSPPATSVGRHHPGMEAFPSRKEDDEVWDVFRLDDAEPEPEPGDFWGEPDDRDSE